MKSQVLSQLMDEANACGYADTRVRDIAFAILNHVLKSPEIALAISFPDFPDHQAAEMAKSPLQRTLSRRIAALLKPKEADKPKNEKQSDADAITAEENKAQIIKSIRRQEAMLLDPSLDLSPKEKINIESQLLRSRTALKKEFDVTADTENRLIIIEPKFNHICTHTGHECWLQTREFAMKHWNLMPIPPSADTP